MKVKNISNKVIGIPVEEGGCAALLPEETMDVKDDFKVQVEQLKELGFVEVTATKKKAEEVAEEPVVTPVKGKRTPKID